MELGQIRELLTSLELELVRFKNYCVAIFIAISGLVLALGFIWPQKFETSAVLYADQTNIIAPLLRGRAEITKVNSANSAKEIVYKRSFLEEVIKAANLIPEEEWSDDSLEQKIKSLRKTIRIGAVGRDYFKMSYSSGSPEIAYNTLVATVQSFVDFSTKQKKDESYSAYKFIDSQVQAYKQQLEDAEQRLKEFKSSNVEGNEQTVAARINTLRTEIESLELKKEETASRIETIEKQLSQESTIIQASSRLDTLEDRKSALMQRLEQLRFTYQDNYPDIVTLKAQIAETDSEIQALYEAEGSIGRSNEGVENPLFEELRIQLSVEKVDYTGQKKRVSSLKRLLENEKKRAEKVAANEAELSELTRDYSVTKNVYEEMLGRKENARLSMVLDIEGQGITYRVHEPAVYPLHSVGLRFKHFAVLGLILGFLFPIGLVMAYVLLDPRIRSVHSVEEAYEDVPLLAAVPYCYTSITTRVLKRDALILLGVCFVYGAAYVLVVANWAFEIF